MLIYVKNLKKTPSIQINGKCEVPFYFVCICQNVTLFVLNNFMIILC